MIETAGQDRTASCAGTSDLLACVSGGAVNHPRTGLSVHEPCALHRIVNGSPLQVANLHGDEEKGESDDPRPVPEPVS